LQYSGVEALARSFERTAGSFQVDRQHGQERYVELWVEAAGMLAQAFKIASGYGVPVYTCSGYLSVTATKQVADLADGRDVPTLVLQVGDYDPSGENIFDVLVEDADAFSEGGIEGRRVGITAEQIAAHDIPTSPPKRSDTRSKRWGDKGTAQCEALPPDLLASTIRGAIEDELDMDAYAEQVERELAQRDEALARLDGFGGPRAASRQEVVW
jgi:hypothetical protein